jgi:hypothetical protein
MGIFYFLIGSIATLAVLMLCFVAGAYWERRRGVPARSNSARYRTISQDRFNEAVRVKAKEFGNG